MRNYFLTFIFILGMISFSFAQITISYELKTSMEFYQANKFLKGEGKNVLTEKEIKGSPYLNDEFVNGSIFTVQKLKYVDIPLRYNIYNDDLEFKTPANEVQALATPEIVEKAVFGTTQLVYLPFLQANKIKKGFFVVLEEGKASLYTKPGVLFQEAAKPGPFKEAEPPTFVKRADEYYIKIGTEHAILIKSKKNLVTAFPDNQEKIERFIDMNKIKTNKSESLKEVVAYYNSL